MEGERTILGHIKDKGQMNCHDLYLTCGVSDLQSDPPPCVCSVKNEPVSLQRAADLHLVLSALTEVTRYTLQTHEEEI